MAAHAEGNRIGSIVRTLVAGVVVAIGVAVALLAITVDDGPAEAGSLRLTSPLHHPRRSLEASLARSSGCLGLPLATTRSG